MSSKPTKFQQAIADRIRVGIHADHLTTARPSETLLRVEHPIVSFDSFMVGDLMRAHRCIAEPSFQLGRYELFKITRDGTVEQA